MQRSIYLAIFFTFVLACSDSQMSGSGDKSRSPVAWDEDPNYKKESKDDLKRKKSKTSNKKATNDEADAGKDEDKLSTSSGSKVVKKTKTTKKKKTKTASKSDKKDSNDTPSGSLEPLPPAADRFDILKDVVINEVEDSNTTFFETKLKLLVGDSEVEIDGESFFLGPRNLNQNKAEARQYLTQEYEALGFEVTEHDYGTGVNLIAEKKGLYEDRVLILGAHYDTVDTVGADDDGTGVIAGLTIANQLQNKELLYTLRIIAFDEEEQGLIGSTSYVEQLENNNELEEVIGVFIIEMIGYDANNDQAFHIVDCLNDPGTPTANSNLLSLLLLESSSLRNDGLNRSDACTDRSDHTPFWNANIPAVVISQDFFGGDSNPCYHDSCDTMDLININYAGQLVDLLTTTVLNIIEK